MSAKVERVGGVAFRRSGHNFEPEHVEINFDNEESSLSSSACMITEDGEKVKLDGDVTITNDGVDSELMRMMKTRCGFSSCPQLMGV